MARDHREVFGLGHGAELMEFPATHVPGNSGGHLATARIVRPSAGGAAGRVECHELPPDGNPLLSDGSTRLICGEASNTGEENGDRGGGETRQGSHGGLGKWKSVSEDRPAATGPSNLCPF